MTIEQLGSGSMNVLGKYRLLADVIKAFGGDREPGGGELIKVYLLVVLAVSAGRFKLD